MGKLKNITVILLLIVGLFGSAVFAKPVSVLLQEGLYAEEIEGDIEGATKIYERIIKDKSAGRAHKAQAMYRLGMCHVKKQDERQAKAVFEKLVSEFGEQSSIIEKVQPMLEGMRYCDPAGLMPAETLIYMEIGSPGKQVEIILNMLKDTPFANPLAAIGSGHKISGEKSAGDVLAALLNPSMMAEFKKIRGMAIGFTDIRSDNPPGVAVLYPGKSDALRGIILAGLGMAGRPGEPIEGMQTLVLGDNGGAVYDDNVIIISQPFEQLRWCVRQYKGVSNEPSLVSQNKLFGKVSRKSREDNALTIWMDGGGVFTAFSEQMAKGWDAVELRMVDSLADFESIDGVIAHLSVREDGIGVEANVEFKDGHHCLLYDLIRTPNLSGGGFAGVPAEAIGVVSFALSEPGSGQVEAVQKTVRKLTGLDVGREIFANIEQVSVFALPPGGTGDKSALAREVSPVLDRLGVAMTSGNPERTRQLLAELLAAADAITEPAAGEESGGPVSSASAKYRIGAAGEEGIYCYVGQVGKTTIVALSNEVLQTSLSALKSRQSALAAGPLRDALGGLSVDTSKLAVVNVGGAVRSVSTHIHREVDTSVEPDKYPLLETFERLAQACDNTSVQLRTGERVNSFSVQFGVSEVPPLDDVFPLLMQLPREIPENLTRYAVGPRPRDGTVVNVAFRVELSWLPAVNASKHKVYLGTKKEELSLLGEVKGRRYDKLPELEKDIVYYWRVDEVSADGSVTAGEVWSFATTGKVVGWWKFDESSGNTALDSSGNGNNGVLHNMDDGAWVSGVAGNALEFDGVDDYVSVADGGTVEFGDGAFSIALWMKTSVDTDNCRIIVNGTSGREFDGATGKRYEILNEPTGNQLVFAIDDNVTKSFVGAPIANFISGEWVHVAAVRDTVTGELRLYRDGKRRGRVSDNTGDIFSPGEGLYIGGSQAEDGIAGNIGNFFAGTLDDVRIYNYALSGDEIKALYKAARPEPVEKAKQVRILTKFPIPSTRMQKELGEEVLRFSKKQMEIQKEFMRQQRRLLERQMEMEPKDFEEQMEQLGKQMEQQMEAMNKQFEKEGRTLEKQLEEMDEQLVEQFGEIRESVKSKNGKTVRLSSRFPAGGILVAKSEVGSITVRGADVAECSVTADVSVKAPTEREVKELAERVEIKLERVGKKVTIKVKKPRVKRNRSIKIDFDIVVPRQTSLQLESNVGEIEISNITEQIKAETNVGDITCDEISGGIDLAVNVGKVKVVYSKGAPPACNADIKTDVGSIDFTGPAGLSVELEASTNVGSIESDFPISVTGKISKRVKGTIGAGKGKLDLKVGVGSIKIR